jgi:hypothetical protein
MKKYVLILLCAALSLAAVSCVPSRSSQPKKSAKVEGYAGRMIPSHSLSIDANYDPRLDHLVAGHKLLSVLIKNMALRNVYMDLKQDRWVIVGENGHKYAAVNSLKLKDHVLWREIPEKMRSLIDYPEIIPINYSVTFDLMFPSSANLDYFREIRYYNAATRQEFILEKEY